MRAFCRGAEVLRWWFAGEGKMGECRGLRMRS